MEYHFGEVEMEVGETDAIQVPVDDVIYNLWGMKEANYTMSMMSIGVRLFDDDTCKETVRTWNKNG